MSKWYTDNRLTLNVKKTKLMLTESKTMLSKFENFEFLPDGGQINRVKSFQYLGATVDEKWSWKCHIKTLLRKLGHRLSVFNRISYMLDRRTRMACFNGLVLSHCDYAGIVWGGQPGLKSEMEQLQAFQTRFAKKTDGSKQSSAEAMDQVDPTGQAAFWTSMCCCSKCNRRRYPRTLRSFQIYFKPVSWLQHKKRLLTKNAKTKNRMGQKGHLF